jgi:hypothetical protein
MQKKMIKNSKFKILLDVGTLGDLVIMKNKKTRILTLFCKNNFFLVNWEYLLHANLKKRLIYKNVSTGKFTSEAVISQDLWIWHSFGWLVRTMTSMCCAALRSSTDLCKEKLLR